MTSPDRAVSPATRQGQGSSRQPAARGTAGAGTPAPAVPELAVGVSSPDLGAPTVDQPNDDDPGWAQALSLRRAHYVPAWGTRKRHYGRATGLGLCGFPGLIDERGLAAAEDLPRCRSCWNVLAASQEASEP